MQFSPVLLAVLPALAAAQYSNSTDVDVITVTEKTVVTEFTTYCPFPTTIVTNNKTIIVEEATTLTITDCPCTIDTTITKTKGETTPAPVAPAPAPAPTATTVEVQPSASTEHTVESFSGAGNSNAVSLSLLAAVFAALF